MAQGDRGHIDLDIFDHYALAAYQNANFRGIFCLVPGYLGTNNHYAVNALYRAGIWRPYDIAQPAYLVTFDADGAMLEVNEAPAGLDPIAWSPVPLLAPRIGAKANDRSSLFIDTLEDIIVIPPLMNVGDSAINMYLIDKFWMGATAEVIFDEFGDLLPWNFGTPLNAVRFGTALPGVVGFGYDTMTPTGPAEDPNVPIASEVFRVSVMPATTGEIHYRVTSYFWNMTVPTLGP